MVTSFFRRSSAGMSRLPGRNASRLGFASGPWTRKAEAHTTQTLTDRLVAAIIRMDDVASPEQRASSIIGPLAGRAFERGDHGPNHQADTSARIDRRRRRACRTVPRALRLRPGRLAHPPGARDHSLRSEEHT